MQRRAFWIDVAVKTALIGQLLVAGLRTAYTDTLGDLVLGLSGSVVAAILTVTLLWPVRSPASPAAAR
jgi:hypothetical protein